MGFRKEASLRKSQICHGRVTCLLDTCGLLHEFKDAVKTQASLMHLRYCASCAIAKKRSKWLLQWAGLYCGQLGWTLMPQLEAQAQVRELEEEVRLETDMQLTTTLLTLGMAEKLEEQGYKLENLACHFAKPGGHKLLQIKLEGLVTKAD